MDAPAAATGFVVWVTRDAEGRLGGTVERVRTGERHRFPDLDALGALIERMADGASSTADGAGALPADAAPPSPSKDIRRR